MFSRIDKLQEPCPSCGEGSWWGVIKLLSSNGQPRFPYRCIFCKKRTQVFCKKSKVPHHILNQEPDVTMVQKKGPCERCKNIDYLDEHHWASHEFLRILTFGLQVSYVETAIMSGIKP